MSEAYHERPYNALPPEVLAVLPVEGHLQLELAHSIACHAYAQKVSKLEAEAEQLQSSLMHSQQTVNTLERRLAGLEAELHEHQQRARQSLTEQHKLMAEKNALIETVKRLNREVAKLEHFKRNLLQQLQEDSQADAQGSNYAVVDMTTERLVSEVLHSADGIAAAAAAAAAAGTAGLSGSHYQQQQQQPVGPGYALQHKQQGGSSSWSPSGHGGGLGGPAGRVQGPGSPTSTGLHSGSPGYATHTAGATAAADGSSKAANSSPFKGLRSAASAAKEAVVGSKAGIPAASAAGPTAGSAVAARGLAAAAGLTGPRFASPPQQGTGRAVPAGQLGAATSPRVDGKEFFRQARARLSYEQFSQFLVAIKELNAGKNSREDTLATAKALFGPSNGDLYGLFEGLLMRHLTSF